MLTMDAAMVEALAFSYHLTITCTPYTEDQYGDPVAGTPLLVVGGVVDQDSEPPVRRSATFTVAAPALATPAEVQELGESLVAGGVLLQLVWTMSLLDGRVFSVDIGLLRAEKAAWSASSGGIDITAYDMGQAVADDRFLSPRAMSGVTKKAAIETLLEEVTGALTIVGTVASDTLYPVTWDKDRDKAVIELATALGCWWWWGESGGWYLSPVPVPTTTPASASWVVPAHIGVVDSTGDASREGTYNAVAASGNTPQGETTTPPFGVAYDDDPTSPTYWDGPFGHKPQFYSSPVLTTNAQCESAAASILARSQGLTRGLTLAMPGHPGLEPGDTISFASGTPAGVFVVDRVTLPLDGSQMSLAARKVA